VASVIQSQNYADNSYPVNIGLSDLFASGSLEAARYDNVRYESLEFWWRPSKAVTTTVGQIGLALDPNPNSGDPGTLSKFQAYEISTGMNSVYDPKLVLRVKREALSGKYFIRCGPIGSDRILYDPGRLVIATQDCADDSSKLGFVEVRYRVKFENFHLEPSLPIPYSLSVFNLSSTQTLTSTVGEVLNCTEVLIDGLDLDGGNSSGTITLPCGQYLVRAEIVATDTSAEAFSGSMELNYNSAMTSPRRFTSFAATSTAGGQTYLACTGYVVSDGTDTVGFKVTLTGAAGTLSLMTDRCTILIQAIV
jgi:hypothetical protein